MWHEDRYPRLVAGNGDAISWFDALMGSWPVLSGAVGFERGRQTVEAALAALERDHQVLLLTPWFGEHSPRVPGKIADYPPGRARERRPVLARLVLAGRRADAARRRRARPTASTPPPSACARAPSTVWRKISPLDKSGPELLDIYGLPPHQQPADIYFGPGYEVRGGWSWYTGAAARMLSAAYAILGLKLVDGELVVEPDAFVGNRVLQLRKVLQDGADIAPEQPDFNRRLNGRERTSPFGCPNIITSKYYRACINAWYIPLFAIRNAGNSTLSWAVGVMFRAGRIVPAPHPFTHDRTCRRR